MRKWCFDETDGTGSAELRLLAAQVAVKADLDYIVRNLLLDAFADDKMKIDVLISLAERNRFDCFGVVLSEVSTLSMRGFTDEQRQYMREQVFRRVDTGEAEMECIFTTAAERFGYDKEKFRSEWKRNERVNHDTVALIDELRAQGGTIALLSNANAGYIDCLFKRFDLYRHFDKVFVSSSFRVSQARYLRFTNCVWTASVKSSTRFISLTTIRKIL